MHSVRLVPSDGVVTALAEIQPNIQGLGRDEDPPNAAVQQVIADVQEALKQHLCDMRWKRTKVKEVAAGLLKAHVSQINTSVSAL